MSDSGSHTEVISAAANYAGYEYQHYHFLWKLLKLYPGETAGFEVNDDVHTELNDDYQVLIQVKHSIQKNQDGSTVNLTTKDIDLWKTLYNWSCIITDSAQQRSMVSEQIKFLEKTDFILTSNKSYSDNNKFIALLDSFKNKDINVSNFKDEIEKLKTQGKNASVNNYIDKFISLDDEVLYLFLHQIYFELGITDIIDECKKAIATKYIPNEKVDEVFNILDSKIRENSYYTILEGNKVQITFEDFCKKYRIIFERAKSSELKETYTKDVILPDSLLEQTFVRQLLDIGYVKEENKEFIIDYTTRKINLETHLKRWEMNGEIISEDIDAFDEDNITAFKNRSYSVYRNCKDDELNIKACQLVDEIIQCKLKFRELELSTMLSNGEYFRLSDKPVIGWHRDWETMYK